jgi:hypothetical protein
MINWFERAIERVRPGRNQLANRQTSIKPNGKCDSKPIWMNRHSIWTWGTVNTMHHTGVKNYGTGQFNFSNDSPITINCGIKGYAGRILASRYYLQKRSRYVVKFGFRSLTIFHRP